MLGVIELLRTFENLPGLINWRHCYAVQIGCDNPIGMAIDTWADDSDAEVCKPEMMDARCWTDAEAVYKNCSLVISGTLRTEASITAPARARYFIEVDMMPGIPAISIRSSSTITYTEPTGAASIALRMPLEAGAPAGAHLS